MKNTSSIEIITGLFMSIVFEIARSQHPDVEDEADLLPHICDLLREGNNCYKQSVAEGASNGDAVYDVLQMYIKTNPSIAHRIKRCLW